MGEGGAQSAAAAAAAAAPTTTSSSSSRPNQHMQQHMQLCFPSHLVTYLAGAELAGLHAQHEGDGVHQVRLAVNWGVWGWEGKRVGKRLVWASITFDQTHAKRGAEARTHAPRAIGPDDGGEVLEGAHHLYDQQIVHRRGRSFISAFGVGVRGERGGEGGVLELVVRDRRAQPQTREGQQRQQQPSPLLRPINHPRAEERRDEGQPVSPPARFPSHTNTLTLSLPHLRFPHPTQTHLTHTPASTRPPSLPPPIPNPHPPSPSLTCVPG